MKWTRESEKSSSFTDESILICSLLGRRAPCRTARTLAFRRRRVRALASARKMWALTRTARLAARRRPSAALLPTCTEVPLPLRREWGRSNTPTHARKRCHDWRPARQLSGPVHRRSLVCSLTRHVYCSCIRPQRTIPRTALSPRKLAHSEYVAVAPVVW